MKAHRAAMAGLMVALALAALLPAQPPSAPPEEKESLPTAFDLRDVGCVTPIKQQSGGTCWAHGTMAAIESNMIVSGLWRGTGLPGMPDLSEYHLDWWNGFNKHHNPDLENPAANPTGMRVHQGGDYRVSTAYLSRGDGIVPAPLNPDGFRDITWYQKTPPRSDAGFKRFYVRDVEWFTVGPNLENIDTIKRRLMTEGAMGTGYSVNNAFLGKDFVHYQPPTTPNEPNHAVAIVGWDDNKVSTDPNKKAPKPGAWLIKNSWGMKRGDYGYFWISYYDKHCGHHPEMGAVSFRNIEPLAYTDVYYHDHHGWRDTLKNVSKAFNAFTVTSNQQLRAVSFYTSVDNVRYTVRLFNKFENGQLQGEVGGQSGYHRTIGFHTVNLDRPVWMKEGERLYVAVELSEGGHAIDRTSKIPVLLQPQPGQPDPDPMQPPVRSTGGPEVISKANAGESYYLDGTTWKDLYEYKFSDAKYNKTANFCIKALAVSIDPPPIPVPVLLSNLPARSVGTTDQASPITDIEVVQSDPKVIYVGTATGGVWKSTDAGKTWAPIFDQAGSLSIGDVAVCQANPNIVWVGTGDSNVTRTPTVGDGIYKSLDAGKTWEFLGLRATQHIGRIAVHPKNPNIVFVAALGHVWGPNTDRGLYKTADGGKTWTVSKAINNETGFCDVVIDPVEPDTMYAAAYSTRRDPFCGDTPRMQGSTDAGLFKTVDAGKTWTNLTEGLPSGPIGRCSLAVSPQNPSVVAATIQTDKISSVFRSEDKGKTWAKVNDLTPLATGYAQVCVDPTDDKRVYLLGSIPEAANDAKVICTASTLKAAPDHRSLWIDPKDSAHMLLGSSVGLFESRDQAKTWTKVDGMALGQVRTLLTTPTDPDTAYEVKDGALRRLDLKTKQAKAIQPVTAKDQPAYRFNASAPLVISSHDPKVLYYGGQVLLRSADRGDTWEAISPDLSHGLPKDRKDVGHAIAAIGESPMNAGLLMVGTDDGRVHVTKDGGKKWIDITDKVAGGIPFARGISAITCSRFDEGTAYIAVNRLRNDDLRANLYKTTDHGSSWTFHAGDLPREGPINVIRESLRSKDVLFVGTEFGLHTSMNGGLEWLPLTKGIPTRVTVTDLTINPRTRELVITTRGRGTYAIDVGPLDEMTPKALANVVHLFETNPAKAETTLNYYLKTAPARAATITITDKAGKVVATLTGAKEKGLQRTVWDLKPAGSESPVPPGEYTATIKVGSRTASKPIRVEPQP